MRRLFLILSWFSLLIANHSFASLPDSLRAELGNLPDSSQVQLLVKKSSAIMYRDPTVASRYAAIALAIAEQPGNAYWLPKVINQQGTLAWVAGNYEEALANYQSAEVKFRAFGNAIGAAKAQNNIGLVYMDMAYYDLALEWLLRSLAFFGQTSDAYALATLHNNIGNVCMGNKDEETAVTYYQKALRYFTELKDTNGMAMVHNNIGLALKTPEQDAEALQHFQLAVEGYRALNYPAGEAKVLTNIGSIYVNEGRFAEAESLHTKALQIGTEMNDQGEVCVAHLKLAELYLKTDRFVEAIAEANASLDAGRGSGALLQEANAEEILAIAYEKSGDANHALQHLKLQKSLNDSIFNLGKSRTIAEMKLKFDSEIKDKALENFAQSQKLDRLTKIALAIALVCILAIGFLIYLRQRSIIRREQTLLQKDRVLHDAQQALAQAEFKAVELEKTRLREEIDYKSREITNLAMNIVRRNDLLEVLDRELKVLRKGADEQKLKELSILVSQTLSLENERKEFQIFVQEAQQNFFLRLEQTYPELSIKEKRLCAMIKLGLSSKEIAAVFNIENSSVEIARHRLRKKLGIDPNASLKEFLEGF
jgi:tetratricopeptide (TPR) repeat protein